MKLERDWASSRHVVKL